MKYIIAITILAILIAIYVIVYYLNGKVEKPTNCKELDCHNCEVKCNKRG